MPDNSRVIADIQCRMVALVESLTSNPELRDMARILAQEFSLQKANEDLSAPANDVDIDASARLILKRQIVLLHQHRDKFTSAELARLEVLSKLIAQL